MRISRQVFRILSVSRHGRIKKRFARGDRQPGRCAVLGRVSDDHCGQVPEVETPLFGDAQGEHSGCTFPENASHTETHLHGAEGPRIRDAEDQTVGPKFSVSENPSVGEIVVNRELC